MRDEASFAGGPLSSAIFRLARIHKARAGQLLRDSGLRPGQELVMMTLWQHGPQRQVDLAEALEADAPTVTRSIARLEKAGLVRRARSDTDGRVIIVEATETSMALRAKVERAWAELERMACGAMPPERVAELQQLLAEVEANLTHGS